MISAKKFCTYDLYILHQIRDFEAQKQSEVLSVYKGIWGMKANGKTGPQNFNSPKT